MAARGMFHHVGTFFLLAGWVLLLVVSISSPLINDLSLLRVVLTNQTNIRNSSVTFGSFGYCILDVPPITSDQDYCTKSMIGYQPASVMANIESTNFSGASSNTINSLTNAMVLHPVACFIAFISFLLAFGAGVILSFIASLIAALAFILTLVIMAIDFSIFGALRNKVNGDGSGSHAMFGVAIWCCLGAMVALFFGTLIMLFSCFSRRRERRTTRTTKLNHEGSAANGTYTRRRKRFILF